MGTRSITVVTHARDDGDVQHKATIYRHTDGYLSGQGQWLADFHNPDLMAEDSVCGQEYVYHVHVKFGNAGGEIAVRVLDGPMTMFGCGGEECTNEIFKGTVEQYGEFIEAASAVKAVEE